MSGTSSAAAAPSHIAPITSSATQMTYLDELFELDQTPMAEVVKKEEPQSDDEAGAGPVAEVASDNFFPGCQMPPPFDRFGWFSSWHREFLQDRRGRGGLGGQGEEGLHWLRPAPRRQLLSRARAKGRLALLR